MPKEQTMHKEKKWRRGTKNPFGPHSLLIMQCKTQRERERGEGRISLSKIDQMTRKKVFFSPSLLKASLLLSLSLFLFLSSPTHTFTRPTPDSSG